MSVSKKEVGDCPVDAMMRVMDGRWKGTILWRLQDGAKRTGELKRSIPGGFVLRLQFTVAPPPLVDAFFKATAHASDSTGGFPKMISPLSMNGSLGHE